MCYIIHEVPKLNEVSPCVLNCTASLLLIIIVTIYYFTHVNMYVVQYNTLHTEAANGFPEVSGQ